MTYFIFESYKKNPIFAQNICRGATGMTVAEIIPMNLIRIMPA